VGAGSWESRGFEPGRELEDHPFLDALDRLLGHREALGEAIDDLAHEQLGGGRAGGDAEGANALAVLPADVPLVTVDTLHEALRTLGAVVLARSADGSGTSLLLRRPPRAIPARFGPDSFRRHVELAEARGLPVSVVERRELSFDVDRPDDILTLLADGRRGRTREVCLQMDLGARLRA